METFCYFCAINKSQGQQFKNFNIFLSKQDLLPFNNCGLTTHVCVCVYKCVYVCVFAR